MAKIYLIPGLGTDRRIFAKLIPLLHEKEVEVLEYQDPDSLQESIGEYAQRLVDALPKLDEPPVLIGMSLGGTVATEMSKRMPHRQLVLISTIKHKSEVPLLFKIARYIPLHVLIPAWYIRITVPFFSRVLRICNKEEAKELKSMLEDRTARHFAWGRRAIVKWNNEDYPTRFIHINGSRDHIFLSAKHQITHSIKGGTHNIVVDRAAEVAEIINREVLDL